MKEPTEKGQKTWVLALTSVASLMVALDALVYNSPQYDHRDATADNECLQSELCGTALDRRRARRPLRPPAHLRRRPRPFRGGVGCMRAGRERGLADRRARRPGSRRGAGDAARHCALERGISAARSAAFPPQVARQGARDLQWLDRAGSLNPLGTRGFGASEGERLR